MKRTLILLVSLMIFSAVFPTCCLAQFNPPVLIAQDDQKQESMILTKLTVKARIFGSVAETEMTMSFHNPHARQLAGDLYFPLPEGAFISGYALDVNNRMVDGVIVEKAKGRQVFEKLVRKSIDPGLAEYTKGNNFKTRIFPLPAHGQRTVMVRYMTELIYNDEGTFFHLPIRSTHILKEFSLRMEVLKSQIEPKISKSSFANMHFQKLRDYYLAEVDRTDAEIKEELIVQLPEIEKQNVMVEKGSDGDYYFLISDYPDVTATMKQHSPPIPSRISVLWDASWSRGKADHEREFQILRGFFGKLKNINVDIDLIIFRNEVEKSKNFTISQGNCEEMIGELKKVLYDGATQMGLLRPLEKSKRPDFCFLFSDGLSNFGKEEPARFDAPLYIFSNDSSANHAFLHYLANRDNGEYFNLKKMTDEMVLERIGRPPFSFISAAFEQGRIRETVPHLSRVAGKRFLLAGKLMNDEAAIKISYGVAGEKVSVREFFIRKEDAIEGDLLKTFWAQKKIEELMIFSKENASELVEIGKGYGLVTPGTSMIVLDNPEQYAEYKIMPPAAFPEWRRRYAEIIERRGPGQKNRGIDKTERVIELWQKRIDWWKKEFPKEVMKKRVTEDAGEYMVGGIEGGVAGGVSGSSTPVAGREYQSVLSRQAEETTQTLYADEIEGGVEGGFVTIHGSRERDFREQAGSVILLQPWDPQTPYLAEIKKAAPENAYEAYLQQRNTYAVSPGFFLDCAEYFMNVKQKDLGLRILSNIAEMELENAHLLRILGHRLDQWGMLDLSATVFEEVLKMRPEEPQSYRDLALILASLKNYERAIELMNHVVMGDWDRFSEIEVIALMEMNDIIAKAKKAGMRDFKVIPQLITLLDVDIRIVLTWDADMTDIDLWVTEPTEEKAYYKHNRTSIGGLLSQDFTDGYGPEEYVIRDAMRGKYKIQAQYYGSQAQTLTGPINLQVDLFINYGRLDEQKRSVTMRLEETKDVLDVAEIEF